MGLPEDGSDGIELKILSGPLFSHGYKRIVYGKPSCFGRTEGYADYKLRKNIVIKKV
jgi:hypothetical protein